MTLMPDDNLAYTLAGIGRRKDPYSERRTMAQRLIAQGTDTSPVQSPWPVSYTHLTLPTIYSV